MRFVTICLVPALAGCAAPPPTVPNNAPIAEIAGRVAGAPQRCVATTQSEGFRAANRNTLLLRRGKSDLGQPAAGRLRRLRPVGRARHRADRHPILRGDLVRSFDPVSKIPGPTCRLGAFIPYTRP